MRLIDIDDDRNCYIGFDGEYEKWNIDLDVLAEAKTVEPQQWIPVSSGELPKSHYWVNVTVLDESGDSKSLYTSVGWYLSDGMWIVDNEPMYEDDLIRVVAWCELPKPWKAGRR